MKKGKCFGEYLVSTGVISQSNLLEALIEQLRSTPSIAEVVHTHHLLAPAQLVAVLSLQSREGLDFRSATEKLGCWGEDLWNRIHTETQKSRRPLGEILIANQNIDLKTLASSLDSFLVEEREKRESEKNSIRIPLSIDFCEQFDQGAYSLLQETLTRCQQPACKKEDIGSSAEQALLLVHRLCGVARFSQLADIDEFFKKFEVGLRSLLESPEEEFARNAVQWANEIAGELKELWGRRNQENKEAV